MLVELAEVVVIDYYFILNFSVSICMFIYNIIIDNKLLKIIDIKYHLIHIHTHK